MKQKICFIALLAVFMATATGCDNQSQAESDKPRDYQVDIFKSNQNISLKKYHGNEKEISLPELLNKTQISFKTDMHGNREAITELDGVISTAGKSWNIYVDESAPIYNLINEIIITPKNNLKIIYENNKQ